MRFILLLIQKYEYCHRNFPRQLVAKLTYKIYNLHYAFWNLNIKTIFYVHYNVLYKNMYMPYVSIQMNCMVTKN